jgi:hypothetical protein
VRGNGWWAGLGKKKKKMGPAQSNNVTLELIQKFKLIGFDSIKRGSAFSKSKNFK